jgi:hypothetical protein
MIQTRDIGRMQKLHDDPLCGSVAERNRLLRDASSEIVALRAEIARLCKEVERLTELVGNACKFNPSEIPNGCDDDTDGLHEFMSFLTSTHLDSVETTWRVRKAAQYLGAETVEELSQQSPARFMLLRTECWGWDGTNWGQIIRDGKTVFKTDGDGALRRLIKHWGVDLGPSEIFAPLQRDFPWGVPDVRP